jgi:hypothetical protein
MTIFSLVYCVQHYICKFVLNAISIGRLDIAEILLKSALKTNQSINQSTITIGGGG